MRPLALLLCALPALGAQSQAGSIEGQVLNASTGEPLRKAQVMLRRAEARPEQPVGASTDAGGKFLLTNIEPGRYRVTADRTGFVRSEYGARVSSMPGMTITVAPGQAVKGVEIKLMPHAVISGRVLDEDGDPVANVNVQALRRQYARGRRQLMPTASVTTNDLGEYRLFGLAAGRYYVSARASGMMRMMSAAAFNAGSAARSAPGEESYVATYYPGVNDPAAAAVVIANPGDALRGVDIQLLRSRTVRISGRIVNNTGVAGRHVMLDLRPRDSGSYAGRVGGSARGADGRFELRGVAPGSYVLTAVLFVDNKYYSARVPVDVGAVNVDDIQLQLAPGAELKGALRVDGETPLDMKGIRVFLAPRGEVSFGGGMESVKADGSFALRNVGIDEFTVSLTGLPEAFYVKTIRLGERDITNGLLDVSQAGSAGTMEIVVSPKAARLEGVVISEEGKPLAGVQVVLVPEGERRQNQSYYKTGVADQNGAFSLRGVAPGEYRAFALEQVEPGVWHDPEFIASIESKGEKVSLSESGAETRQLKPVR
jgi:5-hydroxyisourate hydrolase-like protein (transthyretin family)